VLAPNGTARFIERRQVAKQAFERGIRPARHERRRSHPCRSRGRRQQLLGIGVAAERIAVIPNPIDLDEFSQPVRRVIRPRV
jgi:hypothetical protein